MVNRVMSAERVRIALTSEEKTSSRSKTGRTIDQARLSKEFETMTLAEWVTGKNYEDVA